MALSVSRLNALVRDAGDQSHRANKAADMLNGAVVVGSLAQIGIPLTGRDTGPVLPQHSAVGGDRIPGRRLPHLHVCQSLTTEFWHPYRNSRVGPLEVSPLPNPEAWKAVKVPPDASGEV
jgi:hypothetical protein